jgi:RimJ/RimL family protein N-acetyltransferase
MILEAYSPEHLREIDLQDSQRSFYEYEARDEYAIELTRGLAYTVRIEGTIMVCGGVMSVDESTGHLWCFMSRSAGKHMLALHRVTRRFMEVSGKKTLHATTDADFPRGCRWLEMLGFSQAAILHDYDPAGRDHILYTKVL